MRKLVGLTLSAVLCLGTMGCAANSANSADTSEEATETTEAADQTEAASTTEAAAGDLSDEQTAFLDAFESDGYAEVGSYKVEKMAEGVYHMDEETKAVPGGCDDSRLRGQGDGRDRVRCHEQPLVHILSLPTTRSL